MTIHPCVKAFTTTGGMGLSPSALMVMVENARLNRKSSAYKMALRSMLLDPSKVSLPFRRKFVHVAVSTAMMFERTRLFDVNRQRSQNSMSSNNAVDPPISRYFAIWITRSFLIVAGILSWGNMLFRFIASILLSTALDFLHQIDRAAFAFYVKTA